MAITHDTGITQYLKYGTGGSADTYAGRVTGGELRGDPNAIWRPSVGGKHAPGRSAPVNLGGSATIEIADVTLVSYFSRASYTIPSLSALTFEGALIGDNNQGWTQTTCYINTLEARIAVGDPLTCTIDWLATDEANQGSPAAPTQSAVSFEWFEGICTLQGITYDMQSFSIRASNNLEALTHIETKSSNEKLLPQDFKVGNETMEVSIEVLAHPATMGVDLWNIHEDAQITGVDAILTATSGAGTVTFTCANLMGGAHRLPFETADGKVVYALELSGEPNNASTFIIS